MAYEMKELTGSLFKNERKTSDTHSNATGSCLIDGVEYWVNAWTKKDKNGNPWQSLAFRRKEEKPFVPPKQPAYRGDEMADDIPF